MTRLVEYETESFQVVNERRGNDRLSLLSWGDMFRMTSVDIAEMAGVAGVDLGESLFGGEELEMRTLSVGEIKIILDAQYEEGKIVCAVINETKGSLFVFRKQSL